MCCFSGPVHVEGTQIFARIDRRGWQGIVYSMKYESAAPVAMVLPIPYAPAIGSENGGSPMRFVDFSAYSDFFQAMSNAFQSEDEDLFDGDVPQPAAPRSLRVEKVGDYVASFVPSVKDFARLDVRFRMKDDVWRALPKYRDYGFAVFQLAAVKHQGEPHPMAFVFRSRHLDKVFFPTVHVHDGTVPKRARFDHMLYAQTSGGRRPGGWEESADVAQSFVNVERAQRFVRARVPLWRRPVHDFQPNDDMWL